MIMNHCLFSIIIPVYNVSQYLQPCLHSVVKQDFDSFEIILVNDGSTDESEKICLKYKNRYSNIKYFTKENGGLSSARNLGIEKASGEYLLFVDSDDFLVNDGLLSRIYELIRDRDADFIMYLPIEYNDDLTQIVKTHTYAFPLSNRLLDAAKIIDSIYSVETCYNTMAQTKIIRKSFLIQNGLYFENGLYHEDDDWIARTLLKNPTVILSDIEGYGYRHRDNSIITTQDKRKIYQKCLDRITISDRILKTDGIHNYKSCMTYFIYYYTNSFKQMKNLSEYAGAFVEAANKSAVVDSMKYSTNFKHRFLYLCKKIFGINLTNKLILLMSSK